jgi:hypothetical protein
MSTERAALQADLERRIQLLRERYKDAEGQERHFASMYHDALTWAPEPKPLDEINSALTVTETLGVRGTLMGIRQSLLAMGVSVVPPHLAAVVRTLGEARYRALRKDRK